MPLILPRRSLWLPPRFRKGFHRFSPGCGCCEENVCTDCSGTTYPMEMQITVPAGVFTDDFCLGCDNYEGTFVLEFIGSDPGDPNCYWYYSTFGGGCTGDLSWSLTMNTATQQWELNNDVHTTLWTAPYTPPVDCNALDIELEWESYVPEVEPCLIDTGETIHLEAV